MEGALSLGLASRLAGAGIACFGGACSNCPLRQSCTTAAAGRTVSISSHEELLQDQRERCAGPSFAADYRATRPKVERILAHLMLRCQGGRRARVSGRRKVDADFNLLARRGTSLASPCSGSARHPTVGRPRAPEEAKRGLGTPKRGPPDHPPATAHPPAGGCLVPERQKTPVLQSKGLQRAQFYLQGCHFTPAS